MAIHYEQDGPVTVITIDRPEVANAIDRPTAQALADALRRFDSADDASVAVLAGANETFCAGADLKAMQEPGARGRAASSRMGMDRWGRRACCWASR
jgi:enoyl-CoA hydratase